MNRPPMDRETFLSSQVTAFVCKVRSLTEENVTLKEMNEKLVRELARVRVTRARKPKETL